MEIKIGLKMTLKWPYLGKKFWKTWKLSASWKIDPVPIFYAKQLAVFGFEKFWKNSLALDRSFSWHIWKLLVYLSF